MYSLDELRKQNQDIAQLCEVLAVLMENKSLHSNPYVCELMNRFKEKVWMHLVFEDNTIYAELARHNDPAIAETARRFHDSAREIKQRFSRYVKQWCRPKVGDDEHEELVNESREIFGLIRERVDYEDRHIFPLVEQQH